MVSTLKPVLYLDVDDTVLEFNHQRKAHIGQAAPGARAFVQWANEHFEIRPLTMWACSGQFHDGTEIAKLVGMTKEWWEGLRGRPHSQTSWMDKLDGIDWTEVGMGRPWVWVEDALLTRELRELRRLGMAEHWVECNVSKEPYALYRVMPLLRERFQLPGPSTLEEYERANGF